MKITKLIIQNVLGVTEFELDGGSVELTGKNGAGKTSVLDAIKYALGSLKSRDLIIRNGESEGQIYIETDAGISIHKHLKRELDDVLKVKEGTNRVTSPVSYLKELFVPLQLDPVKFIELSSKEQNRMLLDMIEFEWDMNWIMQQFGEIPNNINYEQNILNVLKDIQSTEGDYYKTRTDLNRDIRNNLSLIETIAKDIPDNYNLSKWESFDLSKLYKELNQKQEHNRAIEKAKDKFKSFEGKKRGLEGTRQLTISSEEQAITAERESLHLTIERAKAEIQRCEQALSGLDEKLQGKIKIADAEYEKGLAELNQEFIEVSKLIEEEIEDVTELYNTIKYSEEMIKHVNEYRRMQEQIAGTEKLKAKAEDLTTKIEKARELPGEILAKANIPIDGIEVVNGQVLIDGLPLSNKSDGEKFEICINVALAKAKGLQILLLDGVERLDSKTREELYSKCRDKGVQFIASRTNDDDSLEVTYLW